MVRLAFVSILITLALLSLATALRIDYPIRIRSQVSGGWVEGKVPRLQFTNEYPVVVNEKSSSPYGVWRLLDGPSGTNSFMNEETGYMVTVKDNQVVTTRDPIEPNKLWLETVDTSVYRIFDIPSLKYWTLEGDKIVLREETNHADQLWEFRPAGNYDYDQPEFWW
ncbi:hypothetical protein BGW42_008620 [Actinomortierella wolfii]|nr:hypothetical protein BGW42_008620 [Actinomortierella wolfii]